MTCQTDCLIHEWVNLQWLDDLQVASLVAHLPSRDAQGMALLLPSGLSACPLLATRPPWFCPSICPGYRFLPTPVGCVLAMALPL